jgi:hypothetical protein
MSSVYFGLDVLRHFEVGVLLKIDTAHTSTAAGRRGCVRASNRQNTVSPKYNDDISLLNSQYLISGTGIV